MTETPTQDASMFRAELSSLGYTHAHGGRGADIDREVCANSACENCGHVGLKHEAWLSGRSYRALAICPDCNQAFEF